MEMSSHIERDSKRNYCAFLETVDKKQKLIVSNELSYLLRRLTDYFLNSVSVLPPKMLAFNWLIPGIKIASVLLREHVQQ